MSTEDLSAVSAVIEDCVKEGVPAELIQLLLGDIQQLLRFLVKVDIIKKSNDSHYYFSDLGKVRLEAFLTFITNVKFDEKG